MDRRSNAASGSPRRGPREFFGFGAARATARKKIAYLGFLFKKRDLTLYCKVIKA
jgi:hypothetical protein